MLVEAAGDGNETNLNNQTGAKVAQVTNVKSKLLRKKPTPQISKSFVMREESDKTIVETNIGMKQPHLTSMPDHYSNASGDSDPDPDMDSGSPNGKLITIFKKYQDNDTNNS
jgi:hypothetical protein